MIQMSNAERQEAPVASDDSFTANVSTEIIEDPSFVEWLDNIDGSLLLRVEAAILKIKSIGVITSAKDLKNGLFEKKWNNGLRLYFAVIKSDEKKPYCF